MTTVKRRQPVRSRAVNVKKKEKVPQYVYWVALVVFLGALGLISFVL